MHSTLDSVIIRPVGMVKTAPQDLEWFFPEEPTHVWDDKNHPRYCDWYCEWIRDQDGRFVRNALKLNSHTGSCIYYDFKSLQEVAWQFRGPLSIKRKVD